MNEETIRHKLQEYIEEKAAEICGSSLNFDEEKHTVNACYHMSDDKTNIFYVSAECVSSFAAKKLISHLLSEDSVDSFKYVKLVWISQRKV